MSYMAVISEPQESNPDGSLRKAGKEDIAIIIYQPKAQFAQPAITTEKIAAKSRVFRKVDNTLQSDAEEFNDDHVAIGLKRTTRRRSESLRLASFDIDAEHLSDLISKDTGFSAAAGVSAGLNLLSSKGDHQWDFYSIGGSIDVSDIESEVGHENHNTKGSASAGSM
jgi:hypothetical protein